MAVFNILTINTAGTTVDTINLATTGNHLMNYKLTSPQPRSIEYTSPLRNGTVITLTTLPDVTETAQILLQAASTTAMATLINRVEQAFFLASERQRTRRGNRIFIEVQLEGMPSSFRSEVKRGQLTIDDKSLDYQWIQNKVLINLIITRNYYFESTTKTEIPLKSKATAKATGGVTVYNHMDSDSGHATWVEIDSADMAGVLDTPVELWIKNTFNNATRPNSIYTAHHVLGSPTLLNPILEGESGTWGNGTATTVSNANYSSGQAKQFTWAYNQEAIVATWTLDGTQMSYMAGCAVRFMAKFPNINAGVKFTLKIKFQSLTLLDQTTEVTSTSQYVQDLGVMQVPPWLSSGGISDDLVLELSVRKTGGDTFILDFIHMLPMDGFTEYRAQGYGLPYNYTLKDIAQEDRLIVTTTDNLERGFFVKRPKDSLLVRPNTTQRLYFLQNDVSDIARTLLVQAFYRERRLTV